jgi:peptidyl-prolyl cis-trans isomerase SurA
MRKRILDGESFSTLAVLYSECPSAKKGGELEYMGKAEMDPEYSKAAFSLKKNGISTIVESSSGFHIIQQMDRQEDRVKTRHILLKPKPDPLVVQQTIDRLDSIANLIRTDSMTFEYAARYFSQDVQTNVNGGIRINPLTNTTRFEMDELDPAEYNALKDMEVGEISRAIESSDDKGNTVYMIIKIDSRTKPHRANLKEDYMVLQEMALQKKKGIVFDEWLQEKILSTHVQIDDSYKACPFMNPGWVR